VELSRCAVSDGAIAALARAAPGVEALHVVGCTGATQRAVEAAASMPRLRALSFAAPADGAAVGDEAWEALAAGPAGRCIEELDLSYTDGATERGLRAVAEAAERLAVLGVCAIRSLDGCVLATLKEAAPKALRTLHVTRSDKVTEAEAATLYDALPSLTDVLIDESYLSAACVY